MASGRAKWGAGGTLNRQSALAGPNSRAEVWVFSLAAANGVEGRDLRSSGLRTPSGPEGSSGKERTRGCRSHSGRSCEPRCELGVFDRGGGARPLDKVRSSNLSPLKGREPE